MTVTVLGGYKTAAISNATFSLPYGAGLAASTETAITRIVRTAGTFSGLEMGVNNVATARSLVLRKSGANSNVVINFPDTTTGRFFSTQSDHWAATDTVDFEYLFTGATGYTPNSFSLKFIADTGTWGLYFANFTNNNATAPLFSTLGAGLVITAETSSKFVVRAPGTFQNFTALVTGTNATGSNVYATRKNGAAGAASVTVPASTTGTFEDTTHSDSLVSGDTFGFTNAATNNPINNVFMWVSVAHTGTTSEIIGGNPSYTFSASNQFSSLFYTENGVGVPVSTTETGTPLTIDGTLTNMRANIFSNTMTSTFTVNFRKNAVSGNQLLTIAATTTGTFEDATHSDAFGTLDLLAYMGSGGTAGTIAFGWLATTVTPMAFDWYRPLSEPVRKLPGLPSGLQQFAAFDPQPFVSFGWFEPLSEPVRQKPPIPIGAMPFTAFNPQPFVPFSWFEALSEPVRKLPGLLPAQQQFEGHPPQLRPKPTSFGVLKTADNPDSFLAGLLEWSRITSGEIGVVTSTFSGGEIGVTGPAITTVQVSIRIV
jgi:hypothetical protein